eukprot:CAMPEP_0173106580 /NCGR_PEP_ID=MMETSP1102-20130122/41136_1 /TAXON_ID=49646 /ORGANISM="Geminigera sp., Strain Caron Lab Isolate" /LENGTH=424 /DNA_ID=CAMNT_0014003745 /DNA_START=84 /DNA_END=1355 /DNA_ORIENTATION=-
MPHEAQWMRKLLLFVCVLDGLSLAPSHSPVRSHTMGACFVPFAPAVPYPPVSLRNGDALRCFHPAVSRTAQCLDVGQRVGMLMGVLPRGNQQRARASRGGALSMIMPGGSGFEEAEQVAERLFRLKSSVQNNEDEFDGGKKPPVAIRTDGEMGEKKIVELDLERPLGFTLKEIAGYGIYVDCVEAGGSAEVRGVQRGDRVLATSATVGGGMWEKSTMEGVLAAVHSGTLFSNTVRIRFERDPVLASIVGFSAESSTSKVDLARALISVQRARLRIQQTTIENFEVALPLPGKNKSFMSSENPFNGKMPYGLLLQQDAEGVFVAEIMPEGTAAQSGLLRVGDRITATQSSIGSSLWPKKTLDGVLSATRTRMSSSIMFRIERKVQLGSWEQRSTQVIPASPLDKVAYFSTSGAGISIRKNNTQVR